MAGNQVHEQRDHLARVKSLDIPQVLNGSRSSSRRSSLCSSYRGSVNSEESENALQDLLKSGSKDSDDQEEDQDEDVETVAKVCDSCKEEIQVQQALSVQQARQRYIEM